MDTADTLEDQVRRADPDRWLSSRLIADPLARADVIALYALEMELSRVALVAKEPMMAEIRLTWWREGIDELFAGRTPRGHPVLAALAGTLSRRRLSQDPFDAMIQSRFADIDAEPFVDEATLLAYADGAAGAALTLALAILGQGDAAAFRPAALAVTLAGLAEGAEQRLPTGWVPATRRDRGLTALAAVRPAIAALSVAAFPAVAHLTLLSPRLKGRRIGGLEARARLTLASLRGRI